MTIHVGFTGTRAGLTDRQRDWLWGYLRHKDCYFHHGGCVGADEQAHSIAGAAYWCRGRVVHPADVPPHLRGDCPLRYPHDALLPERPPLERDEDIVRAAQTLIAMPERPSPQLGSGTWSTLRIAMRLGVPWIVVAPEGYTIDGTGFAWGLTA